MAGGGQGLSRFFGAAEEFRFWRLSSRGMPSKRAESFGEDQL